MDDEYGVTTTCLNCSSDDHFNIQHNDPKMMYQSMYERRKTALTVAVTMKQGATGWWIIRGHPNVDQHYQVHRDADQLEDDLRIQDMIMVFFKHPS